MLSVTIPVTERAKPRKIEVSAGESAGGQQVGQGQVGQQHGKQQALNS